MDECQEVRLSRLDTNINNNITVQILDCNTTPASSPPTPDVLHTRSGLSIHRGQQLRPKLEERSRAEKSPKPKKVKKEKAKGERTSKMDRPLTELTKDFTLEAVDIEAYVNRSAEVRRKEVDEGKVPAKVKRPMNSFMLYRKCYQKRANAWCLENNHQIISQICGESWPLEPDEVREQFNEWARIERINHQNAHPGYKFSPTKPGQAKGGKRKMTEELMTEDSELDDYDWQGHGSNRRHKKQRPLPSSPMGPVAYPTTRSAYQYSSRESSMDPNYVGYHPSSYHSTNPGKQAPQQYHPNPQSGEYYQQTIRMNPNYPPNGAEDIILTKQSTPGMHNYLGLPGGQDFDIMGHYQYQGPPMTGTEHKIDPSLISHGQTLFNDNNHGDRAHDRGVFFGDTQYGGEKFAGPFGIDPSLSDPSMSFADAEHVQEGMPLHDPHASVLRGHQEGWQVETMDAGPEFEKWMDGE
ncbi:putative Transcription factor ste11 [Glarea lozoyensis 74030]|uniref:Putative Transcription factor ste11 n=1 Tax=Glarea lozoyensis (strain ATCC 74030 / MF5533) TaxID=1104152 RepID=H0ES63_GLAL7|nr:putative Transcription factor ste11 [Glarea lozoyensis 74030]